MVVCFSHIYTHSDATRFLRDDHCRAHPRCRTFYFLDDVGLLEAFEFSFHIPSYVKRNTSVRLLDGLNFSIDVQLDLCVLDFPSCRL